MYTFKTGTSSSSIKYIFLIGLMVLGCNARSESENQLDYSEIPIIELNKEFSITESENYIPAIVMRVMVSQDGSILVSERSENSIHQFDSLGNYMLKVAGPGRGPGELSRYANPHFSQNRLVMSNNNNFLTEYGQNEEGIFEYIKDYKFRLPGRLRGFRVEEDQNELFVSVDSVDYPFLEIPPEFTTEFIISTKIQNDTLLDGESIMSLKSHSSYVEITDGGNSMSYSRLPYRYSDYFSVLEGGNLLISRPSKSSIEILDRDLKPSHHLKLNVEERPVTEKDIEYYFPDNTSSEINDRKRLISDVKPPFMRVLLDDSNRFWLMTDETVEGKEFVILSYTGEPIGRVLLPPGSTVHAVRNGKIYTVKMLNETSIDVYSLK
ncbi:MAG: hypothetical protein ABJH08_01775 [Balneola sp.]